MTTRTSILIRRGNPADAAALAAFGRRTFAETFGPDNEPQNLAAYLEANYGIEQQERELSSPDGLTLLAEAKGRLVGFAQVRRNKPPAGIAINSPVELWRIYVDRPWQGRGLAQRLLDALLAAAEELGGRTVWLSVWERNPRAIAFYAKHGFRDAGTTDFWIGSDRQRDRVMVKDLSSREDSVP
jgi:ribosomal protein S18 acetylase RimI-like enzyme